MPNRDPKQIFDAEAARNKRLAGQVNNAVKAKNDQSLWNIITQFVSDFAKQIAANLIPGGQAAYNFVANLFDYAKRKFSSSSNPPPSKPSIVPLSKPEICPRCRRLITHKSSTNGLKLGHAPSCPAYSLRFI